MNARPSATRHPGSLALVLVLTTMLAIPRAAHADGAGTIGHVVLNVRGRVGDIVLIDPLGRADRYVDNMPDAHIPGCSRWPGGLEEDEDDSTSVDSSAAELTMFQLSDVQYGRYVVYARAADSTEVSVSITFEPSAPGGIACVDLTRTDRIARGRTGWAIEIRRTPPKGECTARIARLIRKKVQPNGHK
jgi:hypothetical protein